MFSLITKITGFFNERFGKPDDGGLFDNNTEVVERYKPNGYLIERRDVLEKELFKLYFDFRQKKVSLETVFSWLERFKIIIENNDDVAKSVKIPDVLSSFWIWIPVTEIRGHRLISKILYQMMRHDNPIVLQIAKQLLKIVKDLEAKTSLENIVKIAKE